MIAGRAAWLPAYDRVHHDIGDAEEEKDGLGGGLVLPQLSRFLPLPLLLLLVLAEQLGQPDPQEACGPRSLTPRARPQALSAPPALLGTAPRAPGH